ncbi:hypothetical protein HYQ46_008147 [Verticillium longisporum]|nr:hypothetical protein HYQ46_008147 [Verticillium longisporum]
MAQQQTCLTSSTTHTRASVYGTERCINIVKQFALVTESNVPARAAGTMTARSRQKINAQIDCAFANVEKNLKDAGGKGWSQVFRVDSYHVPLDDEAPAAMIRNFAKYMPDHQPIWTCVGVPRLGEEAMKVEFAVVAHDPEGAKTA